MLQAVGIARRQSFDEFAGASCVRVRPQGRLELAVATGPREDDLDRHGASAPSGNNTIERLEEHLRPLIARVHRSGVRESQPAVALWFRGGLLIGVEPNHHYVSGDAV